MAVVVFEGRKYKRVYSCEPRLSVVLMQINFLDKKLPKRKRFKIVKYASDFERDLANSIDNWRSNRTKY